MTKKWSNLNLPGALHYVTGNVVHRISIFKQTECCLAFLDVLATLLREWPSKLIAFVLMPDHFHLIVNPQDGDIQGFTAALKSLTSKRIIEITGGLRFLRRQPGKDGSIHQVWQESFKALPLWSLWMIRQKINYIHANPLRAGLVSSAQDYLWSSFRAFYLGSDEPLPVDRDWGWTDDTEKLSKAMKELGLRY
jgi:putative transposase